MSAHSQIPAFLTAEEWSALGISLQVACCSTLLCLLPAWGCAWILARRRFPGRVLLDSFVHLPLVLPPVVVGYLLLLGLGREGVLGGWLQDRFGLRLAFTWAGAALASAVMAFPLMVRAMRLAIEHVDPRLEAAARTLGASRGRVLRTVTLPLAWSGVLTGIILAFARSLGEFGATMTFAGNIAGETRTLPLAMFTWIQVPGQQDRALRLLLISLALSLAALVASEWLAQKTVRMGEER